MKLKFLLVCLASVALATVPGRLAAQAPQPDLPATTNSLALDWVVSEVLSKHPGLKAARANWEAMAARVPQERAWEDPKAGVDIERSGTTRFDTFTDNEWMVVQTLPLSGKNRKRARAATAEAAAALADVRRRQLDLSARARAAYFRYANAFVQLELNRKTTALLEQFVAISRDKYQAGTRQQADVLMAQTDAARLHETRVDLERQISDEQSQLNVLMNRPPLAELGGPARIAFKPLALSMEQLQTPPAPNRQEEETRFNFDWKLVLANVHALALAHRPELIVAEKKIEAAQARLELAKHAWIPDPELRVEARQFNGGPRLINEYDTGLFINLPWLNRGKYKAAIREAEKTKEQAQHELEAAKTEMRGMVRDHLKRIETFNHHYLIFRDRILPLARQTVEATRIAYTADKATFLELLNAQRTEREAESMLQQHLTDYLIAVAELEGLVGINPDTKAPAPPTP